MNAILARPDVWQEPASTTHIQVVPSSGRHSARPRVIYALITVAGLFLIVVGQLLLSVGLSEGAYEIAGLEEQQKTLSRTGQSLSVELDSVASPQNLAANAEALGMVRNTNPSVFLRLSDGLVLGVPAAATSSAGSVIGAGGLVPNSRLTGVPLVTAHKASPAGAQSAPSVGAATSPVALQRGFPAPTTR